MPIDIRDARVLVVGAAGGIGGAVADAFRVAKAAKVNDGASITFVSGYLSHRPSASSRQ